MTPAFNQLEKTVADQLTLDGATRIALSQAISLKRIADALSGAGENAFNQALNGYGENIAECIQGQFERSRS